MTPPALPAPATSPIRVAFVVDYYFPAVGGGGVPHAVRAALTDPRIDGVVITTDTDKGSLQPHPTSARLDRDHQAAVEYLPRHERRPLRMWQKVQALGADVIVLTTPFSPRAISLLIGRLLHGRPVSPAVVLWSQGELLDHCLRQRWLKKRGFAGIARLAGLFRGVTWYVVHPAEGAGAARWFGATVVHHECGLPSLPRIAKRSPKASGTLRVVFAGRIVRRKGLHLVLRALADIRGAVTFTVIGPEEDVRLADECRRLAAALPTNVSVVFAGALAHAATLLAFERHDVSVLPTESESFGYAVFESMSCGCVPVVSRMTPFCLDDGSGVHVELSVESIRAALQRLVDMDADAFTALSAAARARAERMWEEDDRVAHLATSLCSLAGRC